MKIGTKVTLTEWEQKICVQTARARHKNNRSDKVRNSKIGPQDDAETDLAGVGAEFGLAKMLNCWPDMTIDTRSSSGNTDEGDLIYQGLTIDVKATKYPKGRLAVAPWKKPTGDLFALMVGTFPTYTFKGVISQAEATKPERLSTLGHGDTFLVEQNELYEIIGIQRVLDDEDTRARAAVLKAEKASAIAAGECMFNEAWQGYCKEINCKRHATRVCRFCGEKAVKSCPETHSFVCGMDLCDKCECNCRKRQ